MRSFMPVGEVSSRSRLAEPVFPWDLLFASRGRLQAWLSRPAWFWRVVVLNEGFDLFVDAVGINPILGVQEAGAPMGNEPVGDTDSQQLATLKVSGFQQLHNRAAEST